MIWWFWLLVVIVILGLIPCLVWISSAIAWKKNHCPNQLDSYLDFYFDIEHQKQLLVMLKMFDDVCKKHNIQYFLISGSALGEYRSGGILPFDDDIDIAVHKSDADYIMNRFDQLFPQYYIEYIGKRKSWFHIHSPTNSRVFIDIFPIEFSHSTQFFHFTGRAFEKWPNHQWTKSDVEQLENRNFNGLYVQCLRNPKPYLDRAYPGHDQEMIITHNHQFKIEHLKFYFTRPKSRVNLTPNVVHALKQSTAMVRI